MSKESNKKQLGKGIRALLETIDEPGKIEDRKSLFKEISSNVTEIPVAWIEVNPQQPRKEFDTEALDNLVQSIKIHGIIQPLTLRRLAGDAFQLIAGERRLRAAKMLGLESVPAYIRLANDQTMLEMALVENIQREDLNALEVALSMNRLLTECELTHEQLSDRLGKDRSTVTNYLRLLKLPPEIQGGIRNKIISMGHARALAGIQDLALQIDLYKKVIQKGLSVRALEKMIKQPASEKSGSAAPTVEDPEIKRIMDQLSEKFGSRVQIKRNAKGAGTISIHFTSDRNFNEILDALFEDDL